MHPSQRLDHLRTWLVAALLAWLAVLAVMLLAPSAAGPSWLVASVSDAADGAGVPHAVVDRMEVVLNVAAFVPLSLLGTLLWSRSTWRDWTALAFALSFLVEVVQAVVLSARSATYSDVVANTLGGLVGAVLGGLLARVLDPGRSERGADLPHRNAAAEELQPPG